MKHLRLITLLIIVAIFMTACGGGNAPAPEADTAPEATGGETADTPAEPTAEPAEEAAPTRTNLVIATMFVPEILDAQQSFMGYPLSHELIGQPMLRYDASAGVFVPDSIESFSISEDGKTMTIKLPADYQYANGDPLNAQSIVDAINRYVELSPYSYDYDGMESVTAVDDTTVEIVNSIGFNVMFPNFMTAFGSPWDVAAATEMGDEAFASNPVGNGLFQIKTEWAPGQDLELVRNDNFYTNNPLVENHGPSYMEEALVRFITDGQTRANELEAGTVDIVYGLPASAANTMESNPDIQVFKVILPGQVSISMNVNKAPFDDANVRKAVAMAVNREQVEVALNGAATAEYAFVNESMIAYDATAQDYAKGLYPNDLDAAKALLEEAGWVDSDGDGVLDKDGEAFSVEFIVDSGSELQTDAAPVLQAQLKKVGIDLQITQYERGAVRETMLAGDYQIGLYGYLWADPDILTYRFSEGMSPSQFFSDELSTMLDEARVVADPAERTAAYLDIQKYLLDEVPMIPLMSENLYIGARSWVEGIKILSPDRLVLNDVKIVE